MKEMYEIGMFYAFFTFSEWQITIPLWICVALGFLIQYLLLKKLKSYFKWSFTAFTTMSMVLYEALSHIITGWDLFGLLIIYGGVFALFIGMVIASAVYYFK